MTLETVCLETPASLATSSIVVLGGLTMLRTLRKMSVSAPVSDTGIAHGSAHGSIVANFLQKVKRF